MLEALQAAGAQTRLRTERDGSSGSRVEGLVFPTSCRFVLSAPKALGSDVQEWFGADGVRGGAGTSGQGAAGSVLQRFLLQLKGVPCPIFFFFLLNIDVIF